jgi:hypothetical protein
MTCWIVWQVNFFDKKFARCTGKEFGSQISLAAQNYFSIMILAHEICHFAYYYELFIHLGGTTGIRVQNNFTYQVSDKLFDAVTKELDNTCETIIDEHDIDELIESFGNYNKDHFTKGSGTLINYFNFFHNFLDHLHFVEMLKAFKEKINRNN